MAPVSAWVCVDWPENTASIRTSVIAKPTPPHRRDVQRARRTFDAESRRHLASANASSVIFQGSVGAVGDLWMDQAVPSRSARFNCRSASMMASNGVGRRRRVITKPMAVEMVSVSRTAGRVELPRHQRIGMRINAPPQPISKLNPIRSAPRSRTKRWCRMRANRSKCGADVDIAG